MCAAPVDQVVEQLASAAEPRRLCPVRVRLEFVVWVPTSQPAPAPGDYEGIPLEFPSSFPVGATKAVVEAFPFPPGTGYQGGRFQVSTVRAPRAKKGRKGARSKEG